MKDFDIFTKIAKNLGDLGKIILATGFEKLPKVHKSPNLVTLPVNVHSISDFVDRPFIFVQQPQKVLKRQLQV